MGDWRQRYAEKLIAPEAAAELIEDGMTIHFGSVAADPHFLIPYIAARREELSEVVAFADLTRTADPFDDTLAEERHIEVRAAYLTPGPRIPYRAGRLNYNPATVYTARLRYRRGFTPEIAYFHLSEPDEQGMMSFGAAMWDNKLILRAATKVVAEVEEGLVRTAGDNWIHVDEVDHLVDFTPNPAPRATAPPLDPEEQAIVDVAAAYAAELVDDGDTVEVGVGAASNAITPHLASKHDLGFHSELTSPGIAVLHDQGVFTGRYKTRDVGKMVVTALPGTPADLEAISRHYDDWELYGVDYIHDPSVIASHDHMTSINTGTMIDLTGQVVFDSIGRDMYTGPGGQLEFVIGAVYAAHGKSIHVFPSTAKEVSRIVVDLPPGANVGIPRYLTDYVVTEYGTASLYGKSERQRALELIAIAHPDHRGDLTKQARKAGLL